MRIFAELLWLWKGLGISLLSSAVGVGLSVQSSEKADEQTCRRHHRDSGVCGFDYRAAVALANAQNYLKIYTRQSGAEKRRRFFVSERRSPT